MSLGTLDQTPILNRRQSYPSSSPGIRYFPDTAGVYDGPRYHYEDGVLRRHDAGSTPHPVTFNTNHHDDLGDPVSPVTTVAQPARYYLASSDAEAARLDAADGVINGALHGTPIYKTNPAVAEIPPYVTYSPSRADGESILRSPVTRSYLSGSNIATTTPTMSHSATMSPTTRYVAGDLATASRLDAADGVMDGRHFGSPITRRTPSTHYVADSTAQALRFDAMDGSIDGRHFGTPILSRPASFREGSSYLRPTTTTTIYPAAPSSICCNPCATPLPLPTTTCTTTTRLLSPITECGTPVTTMRAPLSSCCSPSTVTTCMPYPTRVTTCEVPCSNPYADQFLDLRAHLAKDRSDFQSEKARELQELALREARLQIEKDRIELEKERLQLERRRSLSGSHGETIKVHSREEAQRLDMQDGVIDGKFKGSPIEIIGQGLLVPPPHLMGKRVYPGGKGAGKGGSPGKGKGGTPPGKGGKGGKSGKGSPVTPPRTNPPSTPARPYP